MTARFNDECSIATGSPHRAAKKCARGMALIEVLVSLIVTGLFLSTLLNGAATALHRLRSSALQSEAADIARNRVEALTAWPAALPSPAQGLANGLQWKVEQVTVERSGQEGDGMVVLRTFRITVAARGDASPLVDLTVKRLGSAP